MSVISPPLLSLNTSHNTWYNYYDQIGKNIHSIQTVTKIHVLPVITTANGTLRSHDMLASLTDSTQYCSVPIMLVCVCFLAKVHSLALANFYARLFISGLELHCTVWYLTFSQWCCWKCKYPTTLQCLLEPPAPKDNSIMIPQVPRNYLAVNTS